MSKTTTFEVGDRVLYIPGHAAGDHSHPDCELGTVSSLGPRNVFVRFDAAVNRLGWDGATSQACDPLDLWRVRLKADPIEDSAP